MAFLQGKRILITGLLSNRSIAYGIAQACHAQGASLAFTYQNERFEQRVKEMAAEFGSSLCFPLDVAEDARSMPALMGFLNIGRISMGSFTPSLLRHVRPSLDNFLMAYRARAFDSHMKSLPIAFLPLRRRLCR